MNYEQATALFDTARCPARGKPIANNTRLHATHDGGYEVRLHGNRIITITPMGWQVFNCGWKTVTTKERLNRYLPFTIMQRDFEWFIHTPQGTFPFINGMFVEMDGVVHGTYPSVWTSKPLLKGVSE